MRTEADWAITAPPRTPTAASRRGAPRRPSWPQPPAPAPRRTAGRPGRRPGRSLAVALPPETGPGRTPLPGACYLWGEQGGRAGDDRPAQPFPGGFESATLACLLRRPRPL